MLSAREKYVETQYLSLDFLLYIEFIQNWERGGDLSEKSVDETNMWPGM